MKLKTKDRAYKELEQIWYSKLKAGGFEDIEQSTGDRLLKEWDSNFFRNQFCKVKYEATLGYYNKAKQILLSYGFKNEIQKTIWELHCTGISERKIADQIGKYKKSMVHYIISNIAKQIGI
jgi:hypothetical protein